MTHFTNFVLSIGCCVALGGCMGGDDTSGDPSGPLTFAQQLAFAGEMADEVMVLDRIAPTALPDVGIVSYQGNLGMSYLAGTANANVLYGSMTLEANFMNNQITGTVSNVVDVTEMQYAGQLTLVDGQINDSQNADPGLTADLSGSLTASDSTVVTPNATLSGNFFGPDQSHVSGTVTGNVTIGTLSAPIDNGAFVGEQ